MGSAVYRDGGREVLSLTMQSPTLVAILFSALGNKAKSNTRGAPLWR